LAAGRSQRSPSPLAGLTGWGPGREQRGKGRRNRGREGGKGRRRKGRKGRVRGEELGKGEGKEKGGEVFASVKIKSWVWP